MAGSLWRLVLAAGAGRRLARLTGGIPKQFWSASGGRTLLEETLARTAPLAPPDRTVIVVDRSHAEYVRALPGLAAVERIVYQACDRGTAAGVLLGLIEIVAEDSDATVLLLPSDHGVLRPRRFLDGIVGAAADVASGRADAVLFGVTPTSADHDYGWITPSAGRSAAGSLLSVAAFVEKPGSAAAARLFAAGAVWNTMVLVGRASTLLGWYRRLLPALSAPFIQSLRYTRRERREVLRARYGTLAPADFSRDLVARAGPLSLCVWPGEIGWSDLGTPDRFVRWSAEGLADRRGRDEHRVVAATHAC